MNIMVIFRLNVSFLVISNHVEYYTSLRNHNFAVTEIISQIIVENKFIFFPFVRLTRFFLWNTPRLSVSVHSFSYLYSKKPNIFILYMTRPIHYIHCLPFSLFTKITSRHNFGFLFLITLIRPKC